MAGFEHASIERHESLAPFSRDPYVGVVQAQPLKKAAGEDDAAPRKAVAAFADEARALRRQTDPDADRIRRIGEALERHTRWEEREAFVRLQARLSEKELAALARETEPIERARPRIGVAKHVIDANEDAEQWHT